MATITYTHGSVTPAARTPAVAPQRRGFLARFVDALVESRMRQAERELRRYRHLIPGELERAALRLDSRSEDSLPFLRS
jgi:hypothetical protein